MRKMFASHWHRYLYSGGGVGADAASACNSSSAASFLSSIEDIFGQPCPLPSLPSPSSRNKKPSLNSNVIKVIRESSMRFFDSSSPECVTIGSLNLISATRAEPRAIPIVSVILSSLKRLDRFPTSFDLKSPVDQEYARQSLLECIRPSETVPEAPGSWEYRDFVASSLIMFPSLPKVMHGTVDSLVRFNDCLRRDANLKGLARFMNCFFVSFPADYIKQQIAHLINEQAWTNLETLLLHQGLQELKEGLTKRAQEKPEVALKIDYIDSVGRERVVERCHHYGQTRLEALVRLLISAYPNDTPPLNIAMGIAESFNLNDDLKSDVAHARRVQKMRGMVKQGKWQIAQQLARYPQLQQELFFSLVSDEQYRAAKSVHVAFQLSKYGIAHVSDDQLRSEADRIEATMLRIPLVPYSSIVVVDSWNSLQAACAAFGAPIPTGALRFVGVDAEWRAIVDYGRSEEDGCSTLQISLADKAFIFDLKTLGHASSRHSSSGGHRGWGSGDWGPARGHATSSMGGRGGSRSGGRGIWDPVSKTVVRTAAGDDRVAPAVRDLLTRIFEDPRTIKLGWGLSNQDLAKMRSAAKGYFQDCFMRPAGMLDMQTLCRAFVTDIGLPSVTESLTGGCAFFLGRGLDKGEQLSNWDQRPLSIDQMRYAALDAHSLLAIFDSIMTCIQCPETSTGALSLYSDAVRAHVSWLSEAVVAKDAAALQRLAISKKTRAMAETVASSETMENDGNVSTSYTESITVDIVDASCDEESSSPPPPPKPSDAKPRAQNSMLTAHSWRSFIH